MTRALFQAALGALFLALSLSSAQAAAAPSCQRENEDGALCQQQLTNLHTLYNRLERTNVAEQGDLQGAQSEAGKWKAYYDSCAKDTGWACGPWPEVKETPAAPAPPQK